MRVNSKDNGRWPTTYKGINWYELPITTAFDDDLRAKDSLKAARKLQALLFGYPPHFFQGTVGQAYKVMRETFRRWKFAHKNLATHVELRPGGSWHWHDGSFVGNMNPITDPKVHLTFDFYTVDEQGATVKLNGTQHGYPEDAENYDAEFRAQFSDYVSPSTQQPLLPANIAGTLGWVPDPQNFASLDEDPMVLKAYLDWLVSEGVITENLSYLRRNHPKPLPTYPSPTRTPANLQATLISLPKPSSRLISCQEKPIPPVTTTQIVPPAVEPPAVVQPPPPPPPSPPPAPPTPPPHPAVMTRVRKSKRTKVRGQTGVVPPTSTSNSEAPTTDFASRLQLRGHPYASAAIARTHRRARWGQTALGTIVQPSPA